MEEANGCRRSFWRKPTDVEETIRRCRGRKIRQLEEVGGGFWEDRWICRGGKDKILMDTGVNDL
jgi:hypothetical protein